MGEPGSGMGGLEQGLSGKTMVHSPWIRLQAEHFYY